MYIDAAAIPTDARQVVGFAFNPSGDRVALIRKSHPRWQIGKLNGVGGTIGRGESPLDAMRRKFAEEAFPDLHTARRADGVQWDHFATVTDGHGFVVFFFRCELSDALLSTLREPRGSDEPIVVKNVDAAADSFSVIPNLRFLLRMAHSRCAHDWPLTVVEKSGLHGVLDPIAPGA